jgi:hypothetical protein
MLWPRHGFCLLVRVNGAAHAPHIAARARESLDICCQVSARELLLVRLRRGNRSALTQQA